MARKQESPNGRQYFRPFGAFEFYARIIQGLTPGVPLSDLFLVRQLDGDHVPELDDVRSAVQRASAALWEYVGPQE